MYSVVVPTRRDVKQILPTILALVKQDFLAEKIIILLDKHLSKDELSEYKQNIKDNISHDHYKKILFISHIDSSFVPNLGVSYVRNHGVSLVDTPLMLFLDDDNVVAPDFVKRLHDAWQFVKKTHHKSCVLVPTEIHKGEVRSRGYKIFCYILGIQRPIQIKRYNKNQIITVIQDRLFPIKFASSNCIFGPTKLFAEHPFDERMAFVYEDMDVMQRISKAGYQIYVMLDLTTDHQMREKSALDATYIGNAKDAYQKARNRILMVKNVANFEQKVLYFAFGLWIHTLFLLQKVWRFASIKEIKSLSKAIWKGTWDGIFGR